MRDKDLLAQAPMLPVLYFDGFGAYRKVNGVMRCIGFTLELGAQYNLIISLTGAEQANRDTRRVLDGKPVSPIAALSGTVLTH